MKIVFMGTPDISVSILDSIVNSRHEVAAVVTREDKPKGRGKEMSFPPVKEYALSHNIPIMQPAKIKTPEAIEELRAYEADIFVVAAYGQILSKEILEMPRLGCINVHTSLLPKLRGSAPIQWSIIEGDKVTGVTIMQMDEGMDTGDILFTRTVPIDKDETGGSLFDKLAKCGAELIVPSLDAIEMGDFTPIKQNDDEATYAKLLNKKIGYVRFQRTAEEIERLVRGLDPWPSTYTYYNGKTLKIWKAEALNENSNVAPGTVVRVDNEAIYVNTTKGILKILELQLEGKKRMKTKDFLLGYKITAGEVLG